VGVSCAVCGVRCAVWESSVDNGHRDAVGLSEFWSLLVLVQPNSTGTGPDTVGFEGKVQWRLVGRVAGVGEREIRVAGCVWDARGVGSFLVLPSYSYSYRFLYQME
jgi:hypothetical protein